MAALQDVLCGQESTNYLQICFQVCFQLHKIKSLPYERNKIFVYNTISQIYFKSLSQASDWFVGGQVSISHDIDSEFKL